MLKCEKGELQDLIKNITSFNSYMHACIYTYEGNQARFVIRRIIIYIELFLTRKYLYKTWPPELAVNRNGYYIVKEYY